LVGDGGAGEDPAVFDVLTATCEAQSGNPFAYSTSPPSSRLGPMSPSRACCSLLGNPHRPHPEHWRRRPGSRDVVGRTATNPAAGPPLSVDGDYRSKTRAAVCRLWTFG